MPEPGEQEIPEKNVSTTWKIHKLLIVFVTAFIVATGSQRTIAQAKRIPAIHAPNVPPAGNLAAHAGLYMSTNMAPVAVVIRLHEDGHIGGFLYKSIPEAMAALEAIKSGAAAAHPELLTESSFALVKGALSYADPTSLSRDDATAPLIMKLHLRLREGGEKDFLCKALFDQANIVSTPPFFPTVNAGPTMQWVYYWTPQEQE